MSGAVAARPGVAALVLAILLPPVGVFLVRGLDRFFWIDVVLTIVGWVPGMVFALVLLLRPDLVGRT